MKELTISGKVLIVTQLFRLLFGGYIAGMDQFSFNDVGSSSQVLLIYGLIGIFTTLIILGKRFALMGLIVLDSILIVLQLVFSTLALSQIIDPGLHGPLANWWAALLMLTFSLLTIIFALKAYRETIPEDLSAKP